MANVLCISFDGAIVEDDLTARILDRIEPRGWPELKVGYGAGDLPVEQYQAEALALIEASPEELMAAIPEDVALCEGLERLLDWTLWNDWIPVVLSHGWDLYVNAILDRAGIDRVLRHTGRTRFAYQWRLRYLSPRGVEIAEGFKLSYVASYRDQGDFVAFVAGGAADVAAAKRANVVFAPEDAEGEFKEVAGTFATFDDVTAMLEGESAGWLKSFSSTTATGD